MKMTWPFIAHSVLALIFGSGAGLALGYRNLINMGLVSESKKFAGYGFIVLMLMIWIFGYTQTENSWSMYNFSALIYPVWIYLMYQKSWLLKEDIKPMLTWDILLWTFIGLSLQFSLSFILWNII